LESYRLLGLRNPLRVTLGSRAYWRAHTRASWEEARYWATWAATEGQRISPAAFLRAHPLRSAEETDKLVRELARNWGVDVDQVSVLELRSAGDFYRGRELSQREFSW
jgi:hypothetical protein